MIPVNEPLLDGNEEKYLLECIRSGWISSEGEFVRRFEQAFAKRVDRKYGIAVSSGSGAIDAAIEAIDILPGDEVILPAFTIISCINQIVRSGAIPVLVDSDPVTWNMDVSQIESKITDKTRAIMVVHIYGLPVDMDAVIEIADRHSLIIIEDAAEMLGQEYRGRPCGSFGDISTFSFYPNKHITTGEGGMIVTDDEEIAEQCRSLRNLCFQEDNRFVHERLGWNLRMTNLQASVGLAQLERLDEFIDRKRSMGALYQELLSDLAHVQLPLASTDYAENIYWVFGLVLSESSGLKAARVAEMLRERGVGSRPFFFPMHRQPILRRLGYFEDDEHPIADQLYDRGFYIPSGIALTAPDIKDVANTLRAILS